jgi:hypothetical protein
MRIRVFVRKWNRGHAGIQIKFVVVVFSVVMDPTKTLAAKLQLGLSHDSSHRLLHRLF